ncbi:hypothetical protein BZG36_04922 [Bifiguratus adelaidae]|uniref:DNA topoisomerase n=1 Tax=Bifiguratus adelaidae TaxID=1938954 RepID=A0A261XX40_9FUNG|nr:hypothetical protein BZG36_04922 [Bifiguratus adelaidae]
MGTVLMVAEKPSLAEAISKLLAPGGHFGTRKGVTPVHEWNGTFQGQPAKFKFTSVTGHVYSLDFTAEFNSWDVEPTRLFAANTKKLEAGGKSHMTRHLQSESKGIDYLVLWLDCDREGENICFEVIDNTLPNMKHPPGGQGKMTHVYRAKFSALTAADIRKAMDNLGKPNENEARGEEKVVFLESVAYNWRNQTAVDARQELDLKVGVAFTRFQTRFFQGKYGNLDSSVISYGPCQTPTLSFCVERHDRIQSFTPENFWTINVTVDKKNPESPYPVKLTWERGRVFDKHVANLFLSMLKDGKTATVVDVTAKPQVRQRPHALNTVELLKFGSAHLGIAPQDCMNTAERLYTQGYISYPRTETSQYPKNFDLHGVLKEQAKHPLWGDHCRALLERGFERPTGGTDVGDHPPITPLCVADEGELTGNAWRLYDFIARHFIGSSSPNLKYVKTSIEVEIGNERFEASGVQVTSPGFAAVMHWRLLADEYIPTFTKGEKLDILEMKLGEGQTSPPDYLTESEVIELMEKNGIGTDASIPTHINNICQRNYVHVQGTSRKLVPTNLGIVLIHGYQKIDAELSLPTMRSDVEQQLNYIALGQASHREVLDYFLAIFERKFAYFVKRVELMDELFEATFSPLAATGKIMSKCGKCKRYMKYIGLKPQRLHCKTCDETYSLPQNGNIKLYRELKCPLDDFELLLFSTGSKGTGYPVCPYCYNNPPFEGIKKGMACNHCPHPTCSHSMTKNAVCPCPQQSDEAACPGRLILDATSAPRWKLSCNECNIVSSFLDTIKSVSIQKDEVCDCGATLLKVDFRENQNRESLEGCILCDEEMEALLETRFARRNVRSGRGGGRGRRGRGKGRRGRSRR